MSSVRKILGEMSALLEQHNESSNALVKALHGDEETLWHYLISNDLWGGAGSVADQAMIGDCEERKKLEALMISLGREQTKLGRVNARTGMWVSAFEEWQAKKIR